MNSRAPTEEQRRAIETIREWVSEGVSLIALSGPAGSGKSTVIEVLQHEIPHVIVSAMTNKAADVLRRKGIYEAKTTHQAGLATVFSEPGKTLLRYFRSDSRVVGSDEAILLEHFPVKKLEKAWQLVQDGEGNAAATAVLGIDDFFGTYFSEWKEQEEKEGVLIIDEASMLGSRILAVLQKTYSQIILVGDEMQLQPIKDEPVFWKVKHTVCLTEIHRQSANSESLALANKLRAGEEIQIGPAIPMQIYLCKRLVPIIVWRNDTRTTLTLNIRKKLRYGKAPVVGEPIVCRETKKLAGVRFANNSIWKIVGTDGAGKYALADEGKQITNKMISLNIEEYGERAGAGLLCRFGYVFTCYNAQGSEWPVVMIHAGEAQAIVDAKLEDSKNWLYTAVTRAEEKIIWVSSAAGGLFQLFGTNLRG